MELLDYVEDQARRNAAFRLDTMELLNKRAHTLAALLLGGGGATGSYVLGKWDAVNVSLPLAAMAGVSLWWFGLALWLALRGLCTREVLPPAGDPGPLLAHAHDALKAYIDRSRLEGDEVDPALHLLREGQIEVVQKAIAGYASNNSAVARVLDRTYKLAAISPFIAMASWATCAAWMRWV